MVAISLYRGNLHRVPDVPRRWPMPPPGISLRYFKLLLFKRSRSLSRFPTIPTVPTAAAAATTTTTTVNCTITASVGTKRSREEKEEGMGDNGCPKSDAPLSSTPKGEDLTEPEVIGPSVPHPAPTSTASGNVKGPENNSNVDDNTAGGSGDEDVKMEASNLDTVNDKEDRKRELKQKLDILNDKKHHLVQMLKQILNTEEEMKKRVSVQPSCIRASAPLQVETAADAGSVTKQVAPRMSIEVLTPRASSSSIGTISLSGHQGHTTSPPPVSVSGTHFVASSPSPAASGGTSSVFKDSRLTSPPWNWK